MEALAAKPDAWLELVGEAQQKQMQIAAGLRDNQEAVSPKKGDRRFAAAQWHDNPFFSFLMQNYLLGGDTLLAAIDRADISDEDKKLLRFAAGQYVDAASPANFPMTNPEVIEDAAGSGGQNFAEGMRPLYAGYAGRRNLQHRQNRLRRRRQHRADSGRGDFSKRHYATD